MHRKNIKKKTLKIRRICPKPFNTFISVRTKWNITTSNSDQIIFLRTAYNQMKCVRC